MKRQKYSLAALALVVLAACDKSEMPGFLSDPDAVRIEAAVGALTKSNPLGTTLEDQMKFNDGDRIAVTNAGKTVVYKLNGGTWAPENSSEYLKWDKNDLKFIAKYPAGYTTLPTDQSTKEKLAAADRMSVDHTYSYIPTNRILSTSLFRENVLVKIKIAGYLDQYKEGETYIKNLWLNNVQFPLIQDKEGNYVEGSYPMGTVGCTYIAILEPNSGAEDEYFVEMILHKANQEEGPLRVKGIPKLEAGHAYTFKLYVGKNTVKIGSVTVNEWTSGDALPDGETDPVGDTWDGQTTEAFATKDADGNDLGNSEASPILINSCAQLAFLAQQVNAGTDYNDKFFKLADDLNLAGKSWSPVGNKSASGTSDKPFSGTFDGNGHEVMGLKVGANHDYLGLFGYIKNGTVINLKITSADISSSGNYGAILCAFAYGATITDCSVSGKVKIENTNAGGIVAHLTNSKMARCTAEVEVASQEKVGGLCGLLDGSEIENCTVLAGSTMGVISSNHIPHVGGLVGFIPKTDSQIKGCDTYAKVSGFGYVGGGIGKVLALGSHKISSCTVCGDVSVDALSSGQKDYGIGGFVGYLSKTGGTPSFTTCGFNGTIANAESASGKIGAFIGFDESKATFTGCWYNADKTGELSSVGKGVNDKDYTVIEAKNLGK